MTNDSTVVNAITIAVAIRTVGIGIVVLCFHLCLIRIEYDPSLIHVNICFVLYYKTLIKC